MRITTLLTLLWIVTFPIKAQTVYDNTSFDAKVATVILQKDLAIYDPLPLLNLNGGDRLKLSFDILEPVNEFFNYSIIHCDRHTLEPLRA